jgi:MFS superfamily sulfate permease-like transporter
MFVLLFLTPMFAKLPYNVIGAIIIVGVTSLIEFGFAYHLFKVRPGAWWGPGWVGDGRV